MIGEDPERRRRLDVLTQAERVAHLGEWGRWTATNNSDEIPV